VAAPASDLLAGSEPGPRAGELRLPATVTVTQAYVGEVMTVTEPPWAVTVLVTATVTRLGTESLTVPGRAGRARRRRRNGAVSFT
jgi:hypothetical protein